MTDTDHAERQESVAKDDRDDRERTDAQPLTATEFWARIEAPLR